MDSSQRSHNGEHAELLAQFESLFLNTTQNTQSTDDGTTSSNNTASNNTASNNNICHMTGLLLTNSLYYWLRKLLLLQDDKWLLAMIDIDNLKVINEEIGYENANFKIRNVGQIIKSFCDEKPNKTQGFRYKINGKGDTFAILIKYTKKIENAERKLKGLMTRINHITNETVSVGLAQMDFNETFKEWINRSIKYMRHVKLETGGNGLFSDINDNLDDLETSNTTTHSPTPTTTNKNADKEDYSKLGNKQEFDEKGLEIARKEDENWILALTDCDNLGNFNDENGVEMANFEISKIEFEIGKLCKILGENCLGFKIGGDEFSLIVYDNKSNANRSNNLLDASEIIATLIENIQSNCKLTVSIGYTHYNAEDEETFYEWHDRANRFLKIAKDAGKDRAYWGQKKQLLIVKQYSFSFIEYSFLKQNKQTNKPHKNR